MTKRMDVRQIRTVLRLAKECKSLMYELEVSVSSVSSVEGWSGTKCYLQSLARTCLFKWICALAGWVFGRLRVRG